MSIKGPWCFEPHGAFGSKLLGEDWPFGYISTTHPSPVFEIRPILQHNRKELKAAALIMAAGHDLLEALELVSQRCGPLSEDGKIAKAAIKKARGL